jgi:hypothetical protein
MNENNQDFNRLLRQRRDIEPPGNFEANVWRRIRLAEPTPSPTWAGSLRHWLPQPAFALAAARVIAVVWRGNSVNCKSLLAELETEDVNDSVI